MNTPKVSNPLTTERIGPFIGDMTRSGQELVAAMSNRINDVQFRRAMQIGYMMACQDYGLTPPEFNDPAEELNL